MKITKTMAEEAAKDLTEKLKEKKDSALSDLQTKATEIYLNRIPQDIKDFFKENQRYCKTVRSIYLHGHSFSNYTVSLTENVPTTDSYHTNLVLDESEGKVIQTAFRAYEKAVEKHKQALREAQNALYALRTRANVEKHFPEALPFLPAAITSTALIPNYDNLRKLLK